MHIAERSPYHHILGDVESLLKCTNLCLLAILPVIEIEVPFTVCKGGGKHMMIAEIAYFDRGILNGHAFGVDNCSREVTNMQRPFMDDHFLALTMQLYAASIENRHGDGESK